MAEAPAAGPQPPAPPSAAAPAANGDAQGGRMAELRVTAHVMTLERGLFCVFPAQGSPTPDANSGLPGVRITPTPSRDQDPDAVRITTFRDDGWLENTAALVQVQAASAQVLVSIYQASDALPNMAPRLLPQRANVPSEHH
jgi:hypothetical protein